MEKDKKHKPTSSKEYHSSEQKDKVKIKMMIQKKHIFFHIYIFQFLLVLLESRNITIINKTNN